MLVNTCLRAALLPLTLLASSMAIAADGGLPNANEAEAPIAAAVATQPTVPAVASVEQGQRPSPDDERKAATTLGEVNVRAAGIDRVKVERSLTPGGVTVLDSRTLDEQTITNMADALRYVPGVLAEQESGGDDIQLSIRGSNLNSQQFQNSGAALFQDGLSVTLADGTNHNRFLDTFTARHIIVARGANALTYGASTLGGAIDFTSRTARNSDPMQAFITAGSNGLRSGQVSVGGVSGAFDGLVMLGGKHWSGYREHSQENRTSVYANGGWQATDDLDLRLFVTHIDNRQQLPGALTRSQWQHNPRQANPTDALGNHQLNVKTDRLAAKGVWNLDADSWVDFGLAYEKQALYHPIVDVFVPVGPGPNPPLLNVFSLLVNTDQRTVSGMARFHRETGNHNLLAGINLARTSDTGGDYKNDHGRRGVQTDIVDQRSDNTTLFVVDRWKLAPDWTLIYGAQGVLTGRNDGNVVGVNTDAPVARHEQDHYTALNPRVGMLYQLNRSSEAYANVSRLYEPPTNFDLNNARNQLGKQATLAAAHGVVRELGLRGATPASAGAAHWHWDVSVYYATLHNEMLASEDPNAPGTFLAGNAKRTIHAGAEALVGASFAFSGGRIEPLVSATWNDFTFDRDPVHRNNDLPVPEHVVHGEVMYRNDGGLFAGPTFDLVGPRYADYSNSYRVEGYKLMGLRAGFKGKRWELFAELRNLFDKHYVASVAVRAQAAAGDAILQPGTPRSVYVGLRLHY